ncbi:polysaccharide deacetylase family protein [Solitalea koreensis]|uniref:DUF7033 domain-containing protein n=1 Tax=Solitalea koreensis TaxID=543615 RepID=A0A521ANA1_9SPHI|nr:polysaccharide deacetylase family protein [Solitalea koreensis]SMO36287.1 hypothetical protein SAMN06265350_101276 [Solitalea koreensis]
MNKVIINIPCTYQVEKQYLCDVLFTQFLGIDYQVNFSPDIDKVIIESQYYRGKLILPEILFATPEDIWLKKQSFPRLPLRVRDLIDLQHSNLYSQTLPVIYGDDKSQLCNLEADETYFDIDLLGSMFFQLTLYEEIDNDQWDEFGRFPYQHSIFYKENLHDRALVNENLEVLWHLLVTKFPGIRRINHQYKLSVTHDVDHPIANNNGFFSFLKGCGTDLIREKSISVLSRRVYSRIIKTEDLNTSLDPFNNFKYLMDVSDKLGLKSEFNFIVINGNGSVDGEYDIEKGFARQLIKYVYERGHIVGFHPSFYTYCNLEETKNQFTKLKTLCEELEVKQSVFGGRQHYLRWKNPDTWAIWDKIGADYDSSLGWSRYLGFRTGVCYPYTVFDLINRKKLNLKEKTLMVMDLAAEKYDSHRSFMEKVKMINYTCKYFSGEMTVLFHNNYIISPKQKRQYELLLNSLI